MLMRLAAAHTK